MNCRDAIGMKPIESAQESSDFDSRSLVRVVMWEAVKRLKELAISLTCSYSRGSNHEQAQGSRGRRPQNHPAALAGKQSWPPC